MIPRIQTGTSFKGAGLYYLHDKKLPGETERSTTGRLAWTHTENLLHDDPEAALDEMRRTFFDQQRLRQASGNRTDGRPIERPVVTLSLSWAPDQDPSKEQMIADGRSYLAHMGWQEQQCLMVCHDDTRHPHLHLIINSVHPETGMAMDMSWTKNRSQRWALAHERENGHVYCKVREERYGQGRAANGQHMNRWEWETWQEIARNSAIDPEFQEAVRSGEWDALKGGQRDERLAFWKETGQMRREMRQELRQTVRDEFKDEWRTYARERDWRMQQMQYCDPGSRAALRRLCKHQLGILRGDIQERQKERIAELAAPALDRLAKARAQEYEKLKARHRGEKASLRADQAQGERRYDVLHAHDPANQNQPPALSPEQAAAHIEAARRQVRQGKEFKAARAEVTGAEPPAPAPGLRLSFTGFTGATAAQKQAYAAQAYEQQKEAAAPAPAPRPRETAPVPAQEQTDRRAAAQKPGVVSDRRLEQEARAAQRRAVHQAIRDNYGNSRERGDDDGGRER